MNEKTMRGKKCPKCQSFVENDVSICSVCGFDWAIKTSGHRPDEGNDNQFVSAKIDSLSEDTVACPKCGTGNSPDFRFCKICKHPLKADDDIPGNINRQPDMQIRFDWKVKPADDFPDSRLELTGASPHFIGHTRWHNYAFFVYPSGEGYQILVKKAHTGNPGSVLFRKCDSCFLVESGREFYLGAIRFQVLGDPDNKESVKTVLKSDKTVLRGPGEKKDSHFQNGISRIKILNLKTDQDHVEITVKTVIGRSLLAEQFGLEDDLLRQNGISKEHIRITPLAKGKWLLEPETEKPAFEEINEIPLILNHGDNLRWVGVNQIGEFEIRVSAKEA